MTESTELTDESAEEGSRLERFSAKHKKAVPSEWKPCLPWDWRSLPDLTIPEFLRR
jgi:hypothetical protein